MQYSKLENQIDFLLSAALQKCGNIHDARDLTQDTLVAALSYMSKGNTIVDLRAWLITVMNHKWNDCLRKKYRTPEISIGKSFDLAAEDNAIDEIGRTDEAEQIRKTVAFLGKLYREVIVRHYMNGESVAAIAKDLGIPEGTVKRRLHTGRQQIKKGFDMMENYSAQSYQPIKLEIYHSGNNGINNEPVSLIRNDLIAQNILWAAYEKPLSSEEIAKAIGTPSAYVEPIIEKLVNGELMKVVGNRYYTDFIIYTSEDKERYIPAQKEFVKTHFDLIWAPINDGLKELRMQDFYERCNYDERNSLELYFAINCLDYGLYLMFSKAFNAKQNFPFRKDGGRWIAFGHVSRGEKASVEVLRHNYSGERFVLYNNYAGCKELRLHAYSADGFLNRCYLHFPKDVYLRDSDDLDDIVAKLMYIIHSGIDHTQIGFNTEYLKLIPWLTECKLLRTENSKPHVNIPILNGPEFGRLVGILASTREMVDNEVLKEAFATFLIGKKQEIPAHLDSVPLQKQYIFADGAMLFATIREAMKQGKLYDGKYDEGNQHPCPMFLVIE